MLAAIRKWVIQTMMKGQTGVVQTMPKQQIIEMNTQITAERIMRNGINPEDLKTVGQVENVVNQIDAPKVNVNPGITGVKKAEVFDIDGNKIPEGSKILGGKEVKPIDELQNYTKSEEEIVQDLVDRKFGKGYFDTADESEAAIKARLDADNKKGIAGIKKRTMEEDPEDFATGGRAGYKFGIGPLFNFLNKKSPVKASTDYLKSVKDRMKAGKEAEVAGEVIPIAAGGALITNQVKKKLKAMNEEQKKKIKQEMENKADGGRIGLKSGGIDKVRRLILKAMGAGTVGVGAAKSGIFTGFGKGAGKEVAKEVVQQTTTATPPPYFFRLAEKIKMMGDDITATSERTIAKKLDAKDGKAEYILEEDMVSGDTLIKKINKENDDMITDVEIMQLKKGEVVQTKEGKAIKTPDEYEEVTESNSRIYKDEFNDPSYEDGIKVDEIIKEVDDKIPSIKYAQGGLAYMLGE